MSRQINHRNLPMLLLKARESLLSHFRPIINHYGLTEQQWRIIRTLSERDALEPWQICEACHILSPSLTGVLTRMEEMGLIKRRRVPEDQRRLIISLTPKSDKLVDDMAPLIETQYRLLEQSLGADLIARLYDTLDALAAAEDVVIEKVALPTKNTRGNKATPTRLTSVPSEKAQTKAKRAVVADTPARRRAPPTV